MCINEFNFNCIDCLFFIQFTIMENVVTAIVDEFPDQLRKHKTYVMLVASILGYLLGLTCVTTVSAFVCLFVCLFVLYLFCYSLNVKE